MFADQNTLCASNCWEIEQHAHMAGDSEPARVCDPLAVEHQHIRFRLELIPDLEQRGRLTKAEQSRHVRKLGHGPDPSRFNNLQPW